ncbi:MAG: glutamine synthetase type III [Candidatus Scalindua sp. AMX11]|nr:MAG: glutamine synthetase type III [Candidatus Scalindua sp.]NOG84354.1 glutamine synthetase type III [Planctomycetota bacterium]RZV74435.1 MAG: glutamine synthetase type III [Candidatus Scalindua sp. SCAELEC01]TDE65356.1 MAG: glutamine synthetase type III [Candidatus Scalindua sp. AMX11]GJQ60820.1 MAG: glutamine synthetase [Candidatus Scalindua sp.]
MDVTKIFGLNVFNDETMRKRLPRDTYKLFKQAIDNNASLPSRVADVVANAMKDWAIEKGATHYTHWFQPLTGSTAEKHDSFIAPTEQGGVVMEFSGKQLIKGEPDASSLPSGGLRATFEARGYTAWDYTSPAFLKEDGAGDVTLCIPTAFCSYTGKALDKKTSVLRSMKAVSKEALRFLHAMEYKAVKKVTSTVGAEQEYFLIDKEMYKKRLDLIVAGRTLFGAPAPKGQEMKDHYFGQIKDRIAHYMKDLDKELWKLGIAATTKHNEVAPSQFEMAPIYTTTNIAADQNQLVMEIMDKVAIRHGLVCLLHEKPYTGINGSGKHLNWSLSTDNGMNLLEPGKTPHENAQFLLMICALIMAVDRHSDILRRSAANSGNDHRLGANEAPPAIISIFMGDELTRILESIAQGKKTTSKSFKSIQVGVDTLPPLPKDNSDRNRTSPFAFTGNKFEFRMVPSSNSISGPSTVLNTIVAEALDEIATRLEKATDIHKETAAIIRDIMKEHGRIIFNGNNYSDDWVKEAEKRGLPHFRSTIEAFKTFNEKKSIDLFEKYKVLSKEEMHARFDIYVDLYSMQINVEAKASLDMVKSLYIPAVIQFTKELAETINQLEEVKGSSVVQKGLLAKVSTLLESAYGKTEKLEVELEKAFNIPHDVSHGFKRATEFRDKVFVAMNDLREDIDKLEAIIPRKLWPVPTYADILFSL